MNRIDVPTREEVSTANQALFDKLESGLGKVPNLYATLAHSEHALGTYLALQDAKSSITRQAREAINLTVSQVNQCEYCLAAHTLIGRKLGFSDAQILELRSGKARFDAKLDALVRLTKDIVLSRGHPNQGLIEAFFAEGWTKENLIDTIVAIGDKTITNYLHGTTQVPVDFPAAPALSDRQA